MKVVACMLSNSPRYDYDFGVSDPMGLQLLEQYDAVIIEYCSAGATRPRQPEDYYVHIILNAPSDLEELKSVLAPLGAEQLNPPRDQNTFSASGKYMLLVKSNANTVAALLIHPNHRLTWYRGRAFVTPIISE